MKNLQFIYQKKSISRLIIFLLVINSFMFTDAMFNQSFAAPVVNEMNINTTYNEVSVSGAGVGNGVALADKPFRYTIGSSQSDWVRDSSNIEITDTLTVGTLSNTSVVNNALQLSTAGGIYPNGYTYRGTITIDHTKIDENLTNFPLTVYLNRSNFDFSKAKADGTDISFTDTNLNPLKFEREEHSAANGKAVYNVLVPSVSNTTDTAIYMWYGNPNAYNTSIEAWQDQTGKQLSSNITGQQAFITPGTYNFVVPSGVTSICAVLVGGGGCGAYCGTDPVGGGGGGGGLRYINNLPVTPGETLTVKVGVGGIWTDFRPNIPRQNSENSYVSRGGNILVSAGAGGMGAMWSNTGGTGGTGSNFGTGPYGGTIGGGNGGSGGTPNNGVPGGGGGAGGYSGNGGNGGGSSPSIETSGSGGGGGGGRKLNDHGAGGGGTGIYGEGTNGAAGINGAEIGKGGSGGGNGSTYYNGGAYGGGGGGDEGSTTTAGAGGAGGAVRIIWGQGRAFPSILTADTYRNVKIQCSATYGRRVAYFDGSGCYLSLPNNISDFNFLHQVGTNGKWTAEFNYQANGFVQTYQTMLDTGRGTSANAGMWIKLLDNRSIEVGIAKGTSGTYVILGQSPAEIYPNDTAHPHKIEVDYDQSLPSNNLKIFIDGALVYQAAKTTNAPSLANCMTPYIGSVGDTGHCNGYLLGMRLTNGRCRNAANYSQNAIYQIDGSDVAFCTNFDTIYNQDYAMVQHMGDSLMDATGNGNNGTAVGTTVVNTDYDKARSFDGIDDRIINTGFNIGADPLFTVIANWQGITNKNNVSLWGLGGGNTSNGIESFALGAGNIGIDLWGSSTYEITSDYLAKNCTAWIKNNTGVFNNTKFKIFNNGVLQQPVQTRYSGATPSLTNGISIGNSSANYTDAYSNAAVSEFRVSNIARSDAWIKAESLALKNALVTYSAPIINLQYSPSGTRESSIYDISGCVSGSRVQWAESKPAGTNIIVESNVSTNGGITWIGWKPCTNGGAISDLAGNNTANARLKLRQTLSTGDSSVTPSLSNSVITISFSQYVHQITAEPNEKYTVIFEIKDVNGSITSATRDVYTKAQTPEFTNNGETENSAELLFCDLNPADTEYQIMCDSRYVDSSGTLSRDPSWITLNNKKITVIGLSDNTEYSISAKARNSEGEETNYSSPVIIDTKSLGISAPNATVIKGTEITISPSAVDSNGYDANPYLYNRNDVDLGSWTNVAPFTDSGLIPNTQYIYKYKVKDSLGNISAYSNSTNVYTLALDPTRVLISNKTDTTLKINILGNPENGKAPEYYLELKPLGAGSSGTNIVTSDWSTNSSITFNGLNTAEGYELWLTTRNGDGVSGNKYLAISNTNTEAIIWEKTIRCVIEKDIYIPYRITNVSNLNNMTFIMNYSAEDLEIVDLVSQTKALETSAGIALGSNVEILSNVSGKVIFRVNKIIPEGKTWSGIINIFKFKAKTTGQTSVTSQYN